MSMASSGGRTAAASLCGVEGVWKAPCGPIARFDQGPLGVFYRRKAAQIGKKKALVALARKLFIVAWRMLQRGEDYRGAREARARLKERLTVRLAEERRDWKVVLEEVILRTPGARPKREGPRAAA